MKIAKYIGAICFFALTLVGCKDKDNSEDPKFDRGPIMSNIADNCIIPNQLNLQAILVDLSDSWDAFEADPSAVNLDAVRSNYFYCAEHYQGLKMIDFGPAMDNGFNMAFGIFPTDTTQIDANIVSGTYDLESADNKNAQGLDALDYLLFRNNALTVLQNSSNARAYVGDLIEKLTAKMNEVVTGWNTYRSTFVSGTGSSQTSAFSYLVNAFVKDYEITKSTKLGIPLGKASLNIPKPLEFEAKWSGHNKILLQASVRALSDLYHGIGTATGDGQGFDDYLAAIGRTDIKSSIDNQFEYLKTEIGTWNDNLQERLNTDRPSLDSYYNYMSALVVNLKTDMPSAFGVVITYQDNDGD